MSVAGVTTLAQGTVRLLLDFGCGVADELLMLPLKYSPGLDEHPFVMPSIESGWFAMQAVRFFESEVNGPRLRAKNPAWQAPISEDDFTGGVELQSGTAKIVGISVLRVDEQESLVVYLHSLAERPGLFVGERTFAARDGSFALTCHSIDYVPGWPAHGGASFDITVRRLYRAPAQELTHTIRVTHYVLSSLALWMAAFLPGVDRRLLHY